MSWQNDIIDIITSDELKGLVTDVVDTAKSVIDDKFGNSIQSVKNKAKELVKKNIIQTNPRKPITFLPNFELLAYKSNPKDKITIESLLEKYSLDEFQERFNALPIEKKSELFVNISEMLAIYRDEFDLKITFPGCYADKAIVLAPDNIKQSDRMYEIYKKGLSDVVRDKFNKDKMLSVIKRLQNTERKKTAKNVSKSKDSLNLRNEGDCLFNKGKFEDAKIEYQKVSKKEPNNVDYRIRNLLINQETDYTYKPEYYKAIIEAQRICLDMDDLRFLPLLLVMASDYCYVNGFNLKLCIAFCEVAIYILEFLPNSKRFAAPYYMLAYAYQFFGQYEISTKLYETSKLIDPDYEIEPHLKRMKKLDKNGDNHRSGDIKSHLDCADSLLNRNEYHKAMEEYKSALESCPNDKLHLQMMLRSFCQTAYAAGCYYDLKRWSIQLGAVSFIFRQFSPIWNDECVYDYFAKCCEHEGAYDKAETYSRLRDLVIENDKIFYDL